MRLRTFNNRVGVAALLLSASVTGCGAKTGLLIPDAQVRAAVDVRADRTMCSDTPVPLNRPGADVLFVIDRSGSMQTRREGGTRWTTLASALTDAIARADSRLQFGAKFFPRPFGPGDTLNDETGCSVTRGIDVTPRPGSESVILGTFVATMPIGGTPTASALREVGDFLRSRSSRNRTAAVILATDGGPNCSTDITIDPLTCVCTSQRIDDCVADPPRGRINCLELDTTLDAIDSIRTAGAPVYVVGIEDELITPLRTALDRMAVAGGRPRMIPNQPQYYPARSSVELTAAFSDIQGAIQRCIYTTDAAISDPTSVVVRLDDEVVPQVSGAMSNGWRWRDLDSGVIELVGDWCLRLDGAEPVVSAVVPCASDAGVR